MALFSACTRHVNVLHTVRSSCPCTKLCMQVAPPWCNTRLVRRLLMLLGGTCQHHRQGKPIAHGACQVVPHGAHACTSHSASNLRGASLEPTQQATLTQDRANGVQHHHPVAQHHALGAARGATGVVQLEAVLSIPHRPATKGTQLVQGLLVVSTHAPSCRVCRVSSRGTCDVCPDEQAIGVGAAAPAWHLRQVQGRGSRRRGGLLQGLARLHPHRCMDAQGIKVSSCSRPC